jgi:hypothetical protein
MKAFTFLTILLSTVALCNLNAQAPFITTWKTDNPGSSNSTSITISTTGTGYNYDVDWNNDGTFDDLGVTGDITPKSRSRKYLIAEIIS